jgi:hypothetical protein
MYRIMGIRARATVLLAGLGLLLAACSAGGAATSSAPAELATPTMTATAAGSEGASAGPASSAAPTSIPATILAAATPTAAATPHPAPATPKPAPRTPTPTPAASLTAAVNRGVSEPDSGHTVTVPLGSTVTLVLHNTYWQVQGSSDPGVLALVSGPITSGAGPVACIPGAGCGTVTTVFRAVAPGEARITAARASCGEALQCIGTAGAYSVTIVVER